MQGKYRLSTLGCKVNQYESEQLRELLESLGMRPAREGEHADLAVVNTCAVTCSASAKSRQAVRRLIGDGATETVVIGCDASADPGSFAAIPGVVRVLGHDTDALAEIRRLIAGGSSNEDSRGSGPIGKPVRLGLRLGGDTAANRKTPHRRNDPTSQNSISRTLPIVNSEDGFCVPIREFAGHTRAFLKIQDGCDARCTYCVIPGLRTSLRSKPVDAVVAEACGLVAAGHREIVLTGIYLGAYGRQTAIRRRFAADETPLAALVRALGNVEGLCRLRLSSLEPGDVDDALLESMANCRACVPHLHLPLQSGSPDILRRMNRQYSVDDYISMIDRVNRTFDRPAVSTDIIVGFPGETDAMFSQSLEVADYARFCKIHAFPFSARPGTAAARWGGQFVHGHAVRDRMDRLREVEQRLAAQYRAMFVGETVRVLIEESGPHGNSSGSVAGGANPACGRSDRYFEVFFDAENAKPGDVAHVTITHTTAGRAHGQLAPRS